jgi:hypothetical protein
MFVEGGVTAGLARSLPGKRDGELLNCFRYHELEQ